MKSTVREWMSQDLYFLSPDDLVFEAAVMMKQHDIGIIPLCNKDGKLEGVVTDRDLVIRGIAEKRPNSTKLNKIMTPDPIWATPDMTLNDAAELMANAQLRRLPVVEEEKLIGLISIGDLAVEQNSDEMAGEALSEISKDHGHTDEFSLH